MKRPRCSVRVPPRCCCSGRRARARREPRRTHGGSRVPVAPVVPRHSTRTVCAPAPRRSPINTALAQRRSRSSSLSPASNAISRASRQNQCVRCRTQRQTWEPLFGVGPDPSGHFRHPRISLPSNWSVYFKWISVNCPKSETRSTRDL